MKLEKLLTSALAITLTLSANISFAKTSGKEVRLTQAQAAKEIEITSKIKSKERELKKAAGISVQAKAMDHLHAQTDAEQSNQINLKR